MLVDIPMLVFSQIDKKIFVCLIDVDKESFVKKIVVTTNVQL